MGKRLSNGISALFSAVILIILALILFSFDESVFTWKRSFLFSQWVMLLIGGAGLILLYLLMNRNRICAHKHVRKLYGWFPWCILFVVQVVYCFHAYFLSGWDANIVLDAAYYAGSEDSYRVHTWYFSRYPNNLMLVWLFGLVIRMLRLFLGSPGLDRCVFVLIAGQCLLNTLTGYMCYHIVKKATGTRRIACFSSVVYMLFVGISPWLMVPYSDSMALIFPTALVLMYQLCRDRKWIWPMMSVTASVAYLIKPQTVVVVIAILIIESIKLLRSCKLMIWLKRVLVTACLTILLVSGGTSMLYRVLPDLDREQNIGMLHFVMMGLNQETNGVYSDADVVFSSAIRSSEERREAQIAEIKRRLDSMSAGDMLLHLKKKTLTNYADGTFAWGCEGGFYQEWIEDKDEHLSPLLKSLIDTGSERYVVTQTGFQSIWLILLLGCVLCGAMVWNQADDIWRVMMLSIIGLTVLELILEARARYLYIYAPYYVMLGTTGIWYMLDRIKGKMKAGHA